MITIISYNNCYLEFLKQIFKSKDLDIKISTLENDIVKADKIILPDATNFNTAYRKLQLCNLLSVLRLIRKPVLGINIGLDLMCVRILNKGKVGLGLLDFDTNINEFNNVEKKYHSGSIKIIGESKLISKNYYGMEVEITEQNFYPINKLTKSTIQYNNKEYSLTFENGNYFGINMDLEKNPLLGTHVIENFILI